MPCEIYKRFTEQIREADCERGRWYPQNAASAGVSESKRKQMKESASDLYETLINDRASHVRSCDECKLDRETGYWYQAHLMNRTNQ